MPNKCCVPNCNSNYESGPKVRSFCFPAKENLRKKWIESIGRKDFVPTKHTVVCIFHFADEDIVKCAEARDPKYNKVIKIKLERFRLKKGAVPCKFPECPKIFPKRTRKCKKKHDKVNLKRAQEQVVEENLKKRKIGEDDQEEIDEEKLMKARERYEHEYLQKRKNREEELKEIDFVHVKKESDDDDEYSENNFSDFEGLINFINESQFELPENWHKIVEEENITFFNLKNNPGPVIAYAVVINTDLNIRTYLYGQEINITVNNQKTPFVSYNIRDCGDAVKLLNSLEYASNKEDSKNSNLNCASSILRSVSTEFCEVDEHDLSFITEQITLCYEKKYNYSTNIIILASLLYQISPRAYNFLRSSNYLILPDPKILNTICNSFLTNPTLEEKQYFLSYAQKQFEVLAENELQMILSVDEIHLQPYLDYKVGDIIGIDSNGSYLATTAYVFMLTGVNSNFKEVVHIALVSKIDYELLHSFIRKVIIELEEIGYRIFCVVSNNNIISTKAMNKFSPNKKLSIVYPHPADIERPLFYLYDSVHLLKQIRNNWLNSELDNTLDYPDFHSGETKVASFNSLRKLHELESGCVLKFEHALNIEALFPTVLERQNIKLVLKIFNEDIIQNLLQFKNEIDHSEQTADFIRLILNWWKIVNVKNSTNEKHIKDIFQEPIRKLQVSNDPKMKYLQNLLNWLDNWKSKPVLNKLSQQTHTAFVHTIYGMIEVTKYCFEKLNLDYVLLGKFQTDQLEDKFGKYRQLAGELECDSNEATTEFSL